MSAQVRPFLAMQLAVASHDGDDELRPLVRRLWSAERGASLIPADVQPEIEGCVQDLLSLLREPPPDRSEQLRAVAARVEDVFVTLALLGPPAAS